MGIDHTGDHVIVHLGVLIHDDFGHHDTFLDGLVGQRRSTHQITNGVNTGHICAALAIYVDEVTLIEADTGILAQQAFGIGATANGHNQLVEAFCVLAILVAVGHLDLGLGGFRTGHTGTQTNIQTLFFQLLLGILGNLLVDHRQERIHSFQYNHFTAQTIPDTAKLQPNYASTDHAEALGYLVELECPCRVHDQVLVHRRNGNIHRHGPGGQHHMFSLDGLCLAAIQRLEFYLFTGFQLASSLQPGHLVGLEQLRDAAGQVLNNGVLALQHGAQIQVGTLDLDAMVSQ